MSTILSVRLRDAAKGPTFAGQAELMREAADAIDRHDERVAELLRANNAEVERRRALTPTPRPEAEWHEDMGPKLWWRFPIEEPPYCGSPLDTEWPDYHTHFTPIPLPEVPR